MTDDARAVAARILANLLKEHRPLEQLLNETVAKVDDRDRAFVQELCYGVARWYYRLAPMLKKLLKKPLRNKDLDIKALLLCGMYQIDYLRTPAHAAVSASVDATHALGRDWAKATVNAVLRRYLRERDLLQASLAPDPAASHAHPAWLVDSLRRDWPEHWERILAGNNERPPMHIRVNLQRVDRSDYLQALDEVGIKGVPAKLNNCGISLALPVDVNSLPGFRDGLVSVQDFGAQLAPELLDLRPGQRVLDTCAAPGGKTAHILECQPDLQDLIAVEYNHQRVQSLHQTLDRLRLKADVIQADARDPAAWWDGRCFDRILLDVPCSATGVIRRHPDIKLSGRGEILERLVATQREILDSVWPLLKREGKLVYVSCSVLRRENDEQITGHLQRHPEAAVIFVDSDWGTITKHGRQTLPGYDDTDGFYYAILEKRTSDE